MSEDKIYIKKLSEYMEFVENLDSGFTLSRGQDKDYPLLPSAMRKDESGRRIYSKGTIKYYLEEFKINSYSYMPRPWDITNEMEWMIYAQHYGIPTNLLDFTSSHIVSLLFAVEKAFDISSEEEGVVHFLNPFELNKKGANRSEIITVSDGMSLKYDNPVAIQGRKLNVRINAQNGLFVYFDDSDEPLDQIKDKTILRKIYITHEDKKRILSSLYSMGIGFSHIYPELSYVAKDIIMRKNISNYLRED